MCQVVGRLGVVNEIQRSDTGELHTVDWAECKGLEREERRKKSTWSEK